MGGLKVSPFFIDYKYHHKLYYNEKDSRSRSCHLLHLLQFQ